MYLKISIQNYILKFLDDEIVELFQNAFEADTTNEEYANQYFMALTRINNYDLQNKVCVKKKKYEINVLYKYIILNIKYH